ncbi:MAG TPA: hypothetical protein VMV69_22430 [Pirellulales bacterium]|nr:hypothetical protein [Pirellulales bacterium]
MTRLVVDATLRDQLLNSSATVELWDDSGRLLGMFMPVSEREAALIAEPVSSEEELLRREQEKGYSITEVLANLEKL